jgi:flavodoxin
MKTLIIYYSFEGSTKLIAETIKNKLDADILELKLKKDIKTHGFMKYVWGGKMVVMKESPELEKFDININDYNQIIFGTPVWAGIFVPAFRTFFNNYKFSGKNVALFICHDGGPGKTLDKMKAELQGNDVIATQDFKKTAQNKENNIEMAKKWAETLK